MSSSHGGLAIISFVHRIIPFAALLLFGWSDGWSGWIHTSGPASVTVSTLAANDSCLFAGTSYHGIYRSTNGGRTWVSSSPELSRKNVLALTIVRSHIFAGTEHDGVFRSDDNGESWTQFNNGLVTPKVQVFAVLGDRLFAGTTWGGIFISTDLGESWQKSDSGLTGPNVLTFHVRGANIFAGTNGGLFVSTNQGGRWERVGSGLIGASILGVDFMGARMFAAGGTVVYMSTDEGISWSTTVLGSRTVFLSGIMHTDSTLFATTFGGGVFSSEDSGKSWKQRNAGLMGRDVYTTLRHDSLMFVGTNAGVFASANEGGSWMELNSALVHRGVERLAVSDGKIFALGWVGAFVTTDRGEHWGLLSPPATFTSPGAIGVSGSNLLISYWRGVSCWPGYGGGGDTMKVSLGGTRIAAFFASGSRVFAAGDYGIFKSQDGGSTWARVDSELTRFGSYRALHAAADRVFAGLTMGGVAISTDGGGHWAVTDSGLPEASIIAFAGSTIGPFGGSSEGIFRFNGDREAWTDVSEGLPDRRVSALVGTGESLFAGTSSGMVFLSRDRGTTWSTVNDGALFGVILDLVLDDSCLYVSGAEGVWRRPLSEMISIMGVPPGEIPHAFILHQNYPNPFNPSTTIRYGLPARSHVALTVFNTLGQQVTTLVSGDQDPGYHEIKFDGANLPSGVYFYRMQAGAYTETRKVLLVR